MSLDSDDIDSLLERTVETLGLSGSQRRSVGMYRRDPERPLGLTWAWGLWDDSDPHGQRQARDIANSRALEQILSENDEWADDWDYAEGGYVFRLLGQDGQPTAVANEVGPVILGLESYAIIDDELCSEVEHSAEEEYFEQEILYPIRTESQVIDWRANWQLDFSELDVDEDLPADWEEQLSEAYWEAAREGSGDSYDDQGYRTTDMDAAAKAIDRMGWLAPFTISDDEANVAIDQALAEGGAMFVDEDGDEWGLAPPRYAYGDWTAVGEPPHPIARIMHERRLPYTGPRFSHR